MVASLIGFFVIPTDLEIEIFSITLTQWRIYIVLVCFTNFFNFVVCAVLLSESPKFLLAMGRTEETLSVLQRMYAVNTKGTRDVRQIKHITFNLQFELCRVIVFLSFNCRLQSYPVKDLIPETTGNKLSATKGCLGILKLIWHQTKPIFVAPYVDTTLKLSYILFVLFFIGNGTFLW